MSRLFWQALLAFLALPGVVAFAIPLAMRPSHAGAFARGAFVPLLLGLVLLLACVREFYVAGRGTLAPWTPPQRIVISGLYRFCRNPMYVGVALILWGWAWGFHSRTLVNYALLVMVLFHLRVLLYEEPALARLDPQGWQDYKARVPRWFAVWPLR